MERIEDVKEPRTGERYLVKCVQMQTPGYPAAWLPVFGELHHDKEIFLKEEHYHIDWRFVPDKIRERQETAYKYNYSYMRNIENTHFFAPVTKGRIIQERYIPLVYKEHFREFPKNRFPELVEMYKDVQMKDMICPHKKANLSNCQVVEGVVTCPCHGLKWNVETGVLAN